MSAPPLFPTSLVGSYPQPEWLIDRARLAARFPPRVRARELWRPAPEHLAEAQADATLIAVRAQERAGLDVVTDGEVRRESYSNHFATDRLIKVTVPGPFTMSQQSQDDFYRSGERLALAYADAVQAEIADLFAAGADVVQVDEPYMQARPDAAREYGLKALGRALDGAAGTTAVHVCFGYAAIIHERPSGYSFLPELADCPCDQVSIETAQSNLDTSVLTALADKTVLLGVIDLSTDEVESPETVAARVRRALPHVDEDRIVLAPDCGMKYISRAAADAKMRAMVAAAALLRAER